MSGKIREKDDDEDEDENENEFLRRETRF